MSVEPTSRQLRLKRDVNAAEKQDGGFVESSQGLPCGEGAAMLDSTASGGFGVEDRPNYDGQRGTKSAGLK
jgi:hypothetical protein